MLKAIFQGRVNLLFFILGLVILGEIVWAVFYLSQPIKKAEALPSPKAVTLPTPASKPSFSLNPKEGSFRVGEEFRVDIVLDTSGRKVAAGDAILHFDPQKLSVLDSMATISGVQIVPGALFSHHPGNLVTDTGRIALSGLSEIDEFYRGQGVFGTITFRAEATGSALVTFEFQPGETSDSNLADYETANDVLGQVTNGEYVLK